MHKGKLYNKNGSSKGVGYSYPFVDRNKLKYGDGNSGFRGDEPYIRTDIGDGATFLGFNREVGSVRASIDLERVTKFLGSNAGLLNLVNRNILLISPLVLLFGFLLFQNQIFLSLGEKSPSGPIRTDFNLLSSISFFFNLSLQFISAKKSLLDPLRFLIKSLSVTVFDIFGGTN